MNKIIFFAYDEQTSTSTLQACIYAGVISVLDFKYFHVVAQRRKCAFVRSTVPGSIILTVGGLGWCSSSVQLSLPVRYGFPLSNLLVSRVPGGFVV